MGKKKHSKLETVRSNYGALATALACLYSVIISWGDNWFMTSLLSMGVLVCGTIGFLDIRRVLRQRHRSF